MQRNGAQTRQRILTALRDRPGINKAQLRRQTGLAWTTVSYHLHVLHKGGFVQFERKRGAIQCFPIGIPARFRPWLALLQDAGACRVLDALAQGRQSVAQISTKTGLSQPAVRRHLQRMLTTGVVRQHGTFRPRFSTDIQEAKGIPR